MEEPRNEDARFDDLFAGLSAQAEAASAVDDDMAVEELSRAAWAEVALLNRVMLGAAVVIEVIDHGPVAGAIAYVGRDVIALAADDGEWALPVWGIGAVIGVGDEARAESPAASLGFAALARDWARERSVVRVLRRGSAALDGTIDRVGSDHLDLAEHDPGVPRRPAEVRRALAVPFTAITALRRR